jgi:hypothetical protein
MLKMSKQYWIHKIVQPQSYNLDSTSFRIVPASKRGYLGHTNNLRLTSFTNLRLTDFTYTNKGAAASPPDLATARSASFLQSMIEVTTEYTMRFARTPITSPDHNPMASKSQ